VDEVVSATRQMMQRSRDPFAVETVGTAPNDRVVGRAVGTYADARLQPNRVLQNFGDGSYLHLPGDDKAVIQGAAILRRPFTRSGNTAEIAPLGHLQVSGQTIAHLPCRRNAARFALDGTRGIPHLRIVCTSHKRQ
jgi:hypothetical protein